MITLEINIKELELLIRGSAMRIKTYLDNFTDNSLNHNYLETNSSEIEEELKRLKHLIYIYNEPRIEEEVRIQERVLNRCNKNSSEYNKTLNKISVLTGLLL